MKYTDILRELNRVNEKGELVYGQLDLTGKDRDDAISGNYSINDTTNPVEESKPGDVIGDKLTNKPYDVFKLDMFKGMVPGDVSVGVNNIKSRKPGKFATGVTMVDISNKVKFESQNPNVFKLDVGSLAIDKTNSKFQITRNNMPIEVELMYPNSSGKLSIRMDGGSYDSVKEISITSEEYYNLGEYLKTMADELILAIHNGAGSKTMDELKPFSELKGYIGSGYNSNEMAFTGTGDSEKVRGNIFQSFKGNFMDSIDIKLPLFEADVDGDGIDDEPVVADDVEEDIGVGFTEEPSDTFGSDATSDMFGGMSNLGSGTSSIGSSSPTGSVGTPEMSDGDTAMDDVVLFVDKDDWDNAALRAMNDLVAEYEANTMKNGSGVMLTKDEIINGTTGTKGLTNREVIDKFLKIYREIADIEIPRDIMEQIEDKLIRNDGQFDSFLKGILPDILGEDASNFSSLNNDMFDEYNPTGNQSTGVDDSIIDTDSELDKFTDEVDPIDGNVEESDMDLDAFDSAFGLDMEKGKSFNDIEPGYYCI